MKEIPADFDVQAYGRGCTLQQCEMLTRLAEIGMQLAETAGARALAAQAAEAQSAEAQAPDPGLAFARYAHLVRQTLTQRARAVKDLCTRDGGREARRARHREEVEDVIIRLIGADRGTDRTRFADVRMQLDQALVELYGDQDDPVEDRPVPSVVAGLVCGLGLVRQWRRYQPRYENGRPGLPAGSPDEIRAERASRRAAVVAMVEEVIDEVDDPARIADLKAGLAVRLQERDIDSCSTPPAPRRPRSASAAPWASTSTPTSASRTAPRCRPIAVERPGASSRSTTIRR
ncbi:hypothetical protein QFZ27_007487 [Inquilinus ginsengisoli]|uniref:hypothetical protein n=1 Tax=Inquilinus ginsengisoli TaxID=363840 RepID=UPI003D19AD55